jgi:hypothetical protein
MEKEKLITYFINKTNFLILDDLMKNTNMLNKIFRPIDGKMQFHNYMNVKYMFISILLDEKYK